MNLETLLSTLPEGATPAEKGLVERAYRVAEKAHEGQVRASGDPYFRHCLAVAEILLDLGMPGMGGEKCLKKLIEFDPDVKIIVLSGYSEDQLIKANLGAGARGYARKPCTRSELSELIRAVIDDA